MMSSVTTETLVIPYIQAQETSETLEWADLATLDLSKFDRPGGKHELAAEFTKAMEEIGKSGAWPNKLPRPHSLIIWAHERAALQASST